MKFYLVIYLIFPSDFLFNMFKGKDRKFLVFLRHDWDKCIQQNSANKPFCSQFKNVIKCMNKVFYLPKLNDILYKERTYSKFFDGIKVLCIKQNGQINVKSYLSYSDLVLSIQRQGLQIQKILLIRKTQSSYEAHCQQRHHAILSLQQDDVRHSNSF